MTVAYRAFVPFTAAGQRGLFTPLPFIHLYRILFYLYGGAIYKRNGFVKVKKPQAPNCDPHGRP